MLCRFGDFQFDCDQQVLSKNNTLIQLSEKPSALLSLFLQQPNKIHTKSEILEFVWPGRVVTEQVIFQNISHLRALFGDDAIKTFPKKGYQWQLSIKVQMEDEADVQGSPLKTAIDEQQLDLATRETSEASKATKLGGLLLAVAVVVLSLIYLAPSDDALSDESVILVNASDRKAPQQINQSIQTQQLFDSPYTSWQQAASQDGDWVIATREYKLQDRVVLRFAIQGKGRGLSNYIVAKDLSAARKQLDELVAMLATSRYFDAPNTHAALAELVTLNTDNLIIVEQLARLHFEQDNYEQTHALIESLLSTVKDPLRIGLIQLFKSEVAMWDTQFALARASVDIALASFQALQIDHLESLALSQLTWSHLVEQNFRAGMQVLNQVADLARRDNEPLLEVEAHLNQAFMAAKSGQIELSHTQLDLAERLLVLHKLTEEHQVHLLYNTAWIEESAEKVAAIYLQILSLPFYPTHELYYYAAASKASQYYIEKAEWDKALETIKPWQRKSFQLLIKAHVAFAQREMIKAMALAEKAHQQALVEHNKVDALDAALLVLQHQYKDGKSSDVSKYEQFIMKQATRRWLSQNSINLKNANISIP